MSQKLESVIAVIGIDIGKNSFHLVGHDERGAIVLRQKWSRGRVEARFANMPPCRVGMEACVGAHHLSRKLNSLGHNARLMPAKYVRPYSKGLKNDFRDGGDCRGGAAAHDEVRRNQDHGLKPWIEAEAAPLQRAGDRRRQQTRPNRLECSGSWPGLRSTEDGSGCERIRLIQFHTNGNRGRKMRDTQ
jgi:transposase